MELIPRKSPEVSTTINGEPVILTWQNTQVFIFSEVYKDFNHVYYVSDEGAVYVWPLFNQINKDQLLKLKEWGFTHTYANEPCDLDIEAFIQAQTCVLEQELDKLGQQ